MTDRNKRRIFDFGIKHPAGPAIYLGVETTTMNGFVLRYYGFGVSRLFVGIVIPHRAVSVWV